MDTSNFRPYGAAQTDGARAGASASTSPSAAAAAHGSGGAAASAGTAGDCPRDPRLQNALDGFYGDFHRIIFDPVLTKLAALASREDLAPPRR
eukprot:TRINITY_DN50367_c0_g1_i1.p2 TRINITY_DN50367_c0_g1~~TRINITY_DN50367_c0_g1_i1.p2  ORF type:complete len:106 (+),score=19.03 TRINITY_DN50367_c0_g1_i1:40-318(+)